MLYLDSLYFSKCERQCLPKRCTSMLTSSDAPGLDRSPCGQELPRTTFAQNHGWQKGRVCSHQRKPKPLLYWVQLVSTKPRCWGKDLGGPSFSVEFWVHQSFDCIYRGSFSAFLFLSGACLGYLEVCDKRFFLFVQLGCLCSSSIGFWWL